MRRGLGRGRTLIAIGAIIGILSMPLSWQKAGGVVLEVRTAWGFAGPGWLMFMAAVLMLALILLPYTSRTRQMAIDRAGAYLALLLIALGGLGAAVLELVGGSEAYSLTPLDAPGLWLAIVGMAIAAWGVLELIAEKPTPP
ncbi:MAG TPA: hypothetical protein VK987_10650 [Anaerolineae bacterium]|nr:hypothetical protein [Anaerolineae bacterium]